MLEIRINGCEYFDEEKREFFTTPDTVLCLEHSLISVSKWEAKWHKPFLHNSNNLTQEEIIDYIKFMTLANKKIDDNVYLTLSSENIQEIIDYIQNPMTATWFGEDRNKNNQAPRRQKEIITSELIYYWMVALQIPFECQKWHLNRLLTLIRVCNVKNEEANPNTKRKMSKSELMSRNAALNAQRRARMNTKG